MDLIVPVCVFVALLILALKRRQSHAKADALIKEMTEHLEKTEKAERAAKERKGSS